MTEGTGRGRSAYPGYQPLACGECFNEIFREQRPGVPAPGFKLYTDDAGQFWGARVPGAELQRVHAPLVCVACVEEGRA
jgi:hypothetical protein